MKVCRCWCPYLMVNVMCTINFPMQKNGHGGDDLTYWLLYFLKESSQKISHIYTSFSLISSILAASSSHFPLPFFSNLCVLFLEVSVGREFLFKFWSFKFFIKMILFYFLIKRLHGHFCHWKLTEWSILSFKICLGSLNIKLRVQRVATWVFGLVVIPLPKSLTPLWGCEFNPRDL